MSLVLRLLLAFIGSVLLWLLFVFQVSGSELVVGAVASFLTLLAGYVAVRAVPLCFKPRLRWIGQGWRLPSLIAADLWLLGKHLMREISRQPSRSLFATTRFSPVSDDCHAAAQRALTVLYVSTTPNSIVLDIDRQKGEMLFHQMEPAPMPKLLRKLQE